MKQFNEEEVLKEIHENDESAYGLLIDADKNLARRFRRLDTTLIKLLKDVRKHFPDASYYTASGGFHLMLGNSHSDSGEQQQELIALGGLAQIGDGDF